MPTDPASVSLAAAYRTYITQSLPLSPRSHPWEGPGHRHRRPIQWLAAVGTSATHTAESFGTGEFAFPRNEARGRQELAAYGWAVDRALAWVRQNRRLRLPYGARQDLVGPQLGYDAFRSAGSSE